MQIPSLDSPLFFFFVLIITFAIVLGKRIFRNSYSDLPPGPPKLPLIGNLHQLAGFDLPHQKLHSLAKIYGPLLHLKFGQIHFVIISSADLAREVMKTQDLNFASRPEITAAKALCNGCDGIVSSPYGAYWREMRKICTLELLNIKRVKSYSYIREEEVQKMVEGVMDMAKKGVVVNISKLLLSVSNTMVVRASFGKELVEQESFLIAMKEVLELANGFGWVDLFPSLGFLNRFSKVTSRMKELWKELDVILNDVIKDQKARRGHVGRDGKESLVEVLLRIIDSGELVSEFSDDHMKAVIVDTFVAGTGTAASVMEWGMTSLIRNPNVMNKVQLEIRKVMEGKEKIEESDLEKMPYLKLVVKEIFRLHPPAPLLLPRISHETTKISGLTIPAGSRVIVNARSIGRDPNNWQDPESFWPERFEGNDKDYKGTNFEFIPFGAGRRICPGITFGLVFVEFCLANLLHHFDWKLPDGMKPEELDMDERYILTVTRKNHLYLMATPYCPLKD